MTHYVLPETDARLDYDKKTKGLYVAVTGPQVLKDFVPASDGEKFTIAKTTTVNESPVVNLDYDEDGKLVGVEILLP
jgi:uncharacterized protein YuzE